MGPAVDGNLADCADGLKERSLYALGDCDQPETSVALFSQEEWSKSSTKNCATTWSGRSTKRIAAGMTPEDARYAALKAVNDIEQRKEECRDMRGLNPIDNMVQDFRYARPSASKRVQLFACTAIFVLALGISATVAIFSFVEAALIKPLPYRDQSRLVAVFESSPGTPRSWLSYPGFRGLEKAQQSLQFHRRLRAERQLHTECGHGRGTGTGNTGQRRFLPYSRDSADTRPRFPAGEDAADAPRTVILSYTAWQKRFGGKRDVLGRALTLNGNPAIVIGVLPAHFQFAPYWRRRILGYSPRRRRM